jgi:hypothetical protein
MRRSIKQERPSVRRRTVRHRVPHHEPASGNLPPGSLPPDSLAHDLKNQLAIILGFTELLLMERPADGRWRVDFEEMHKAATHALALVTRLSPSAPHDDQ